MGMSKLMLEWCEEQEKLKKERMLPSLIDLGKGRISKYMSKKEASVDPNTEHSLNHNKKNQQNDKEQCQCNH